MNTRRALEAGLLVLTAVAIVGSWLFVQREPDLGGPELSERPARPATPRAPTPAPGPVIPLEPPETQEAPEADEQAAAPIDPATVEYATDKLVIIEAIGVEQGWEEATLDGVLALYASADETTEAIFADMRAGSISDEAGQAELLDVRQQLREGLAELLSEEERERLRDSMQLPQRVFSAPE